MIMPLLILESVAILRFYDLYLYCAKSCRRKCQLVYAAIHYLFCLHNFTILLAQKHFVVNESFDKYCKKYC